MKEYKFEEANTSKNLPAKIGVFGKIRNYLFKDIDFNKPIVLELTPKEEKVLTEVHDFLFQEIKFPELHDFFFQDLNIFKKKAPAAEEVPADGVNNGADDAQGVSGVEGVTENAEGVGGSGNDGENVNV